MCQIPVISFGALFKDRSSFGYILLITKEWTKLDVKFRPSQWCARWVWIHPHFQASSANIYLKAIRLWPLRKRQLKAIDWGPHPMCVRYLFGTTDDEWIYWWFHGIVQIFHQEEGWPHLELERPHRPIMGIDRGKHPQISRTFEINELSSWSIQIYIHVYSVYP